MTKHYFGEKCRILGIIFWLKMSGFTHHFSGRVYAFKNLHLGKVWLFDVICSPLELTLGTKDSVEYENTRPGRRVRNVSLIIAFSRVD